VTGINVTVTSDTIEESGLSSCKFYLYEGDYTASADFDSGTFKKNFTVERQAMTVTVNEAETRLKGKITDKETGEGLGGATVNILWSDGSVNSTTADSNGNYDFLISPRESGTIAFDAANYSRHTQKLEVTPGEENTLNAELSPAYEVKFTVIKTDGNTASGLSILGTGLDKTPVTGADGTVTVELAGDEYTFSTSNSVSSTFTTVTVDRDMEITLTLQENYMEWWFDEPTSTLYIKGLGPMEAFNGAVPWAAHTAAIQHAEITGMSSVGSNAFKNHAALKTIKLPDTLTKISSYAFNGCTSLSDVIIPDEVV